MHVVNVAVDDMVFESSAFDAVIKDSTPAVAANLAQLVAVGGICNSAMFGAESEDGSGKTIAGDATGMRADHLYQRVSYGLSLQILLFCDSLTA